MVSFEISSVLQLSESEGYCISNALASQPMGDIVIDWCRYIQETSLNEIDIKILNLKRNGTFLGIGILTIIRNLNFTNLLPSSLEKYRTLFDRFHYNPFVFNIGVLNIPLMHRPGLLTVPGIGSAEYLQLYLDIVHFLRKNKFEMHALCICTDPAIRADHLFSKNKLVARLFDFRAMLDFPYRCFEEYCATLSRVKRYDIRRGNKKLEKFGGKIELCNDFNSIADEVTHLYQNISSFKGGLHLIDIGNKYFSTLDRLKITYPQLLLVRSPDKLVAFFQLFQSGKTLHIKSCGLDYDLSYKMWAYFNLFYASMEYAAEHNLTEIDCGITNNLFKEHKLNCQIIPITYWIDFYHPIFMPVKLMMRLIS